MTATPLTDTLLSWAMVIAMWSLALGVAAVVAAFIVWGWRELSCRGPKP
jgi:hypothetical protein